MKETESEDFPLTIENENTPSESQTPKSRPINCPKMTGFWLLALSSNLGTCVTYYRSAIDFPEHMKWQQSIDQFHSPTDIEFFVAILVGSTSIFISNQRSLPVRIKHFFVPHSEQEQASRLKGLALINDIVAVAFKTLISSTSLLALFSDFRSPYGYLGIVVALLTFPGNAFANLANVWEPFQQQTRCCSSKSTAQRMATICSASYALSQGALYYNQFDAGFDHAHWLIKGRVSGLDNGNKIALFIGAIFFSGIFTYKTKTMYQNKIRRVLQAKKRRLLLPEDHQQHRGEVSTCERIDTGIVCSSTWKSAVMSLVVIGLFKGFNEPASGIAFAALLLLCNIVVNLTLYSHHPKDVLKIKNSKENQPVMN
mgnify:CR=1 FL=1